MEDHLDSQKDLGGRPALELDLKELEQLCALHCTQQDIAGWFNCSVATIERRIASDERLEYAGKRLTFREIMDRGYAKGRVSLRRRQMEAADNGNPAMLIWLGKQLLQQKDRWAGEVSGADGKPLIDVASVRAYLQSVRSGK